MTVSEEDPRVRAGGSAVDLEGIAAADFVRIYPRCLPDSLVACGLLARYCYDQDIPFHVHPLDVSTTASCEEDLPDDVLELALSSSASDTDRPVCYRVYNSLLDRGSTPDPAYTLAGIAAADFDPETVAPEILESIECLREPGIGIPTTNRVMGLACSTLHHTDYSGDSDATRAALEAFGIPDPGAASPKDLASFAAVTSVTSAQSTEQSAAGLDRFLHPHTIEHPYRSIEGYSDVIRVLSQPRPGHVISLALPDPAYESTRSTWQIHADQAHTVVQSATPTVTDHYYRADIDTEFGLVPARLLSYHTTHASVITATSSHIALYTRDPPVPDGFEHATAAMNGSSVTTHNTGIAVLPPDTRADFFTTLDDMYQ